MREGGGGAGLGVEARKQAFPKDASARTVLYCTVRRVGGLKPERHRGGIGVLGMGRYLQYLAAASPPGARNGIVIGQHFRAHPLT
jgi:hypothetical protein